MSYTSDIILAAVNKEPTAVQAAFDAAVKSKIAERIEGLNQEVAASMFGAAAGEASGSDE